MADPDFTSEMRQQQAEIERLKRERDGYREELDKLQEEAEQRVSAQLRLLSRDLTDEIQGKFFDRLKVMLWIAGILLFVATAGGFWTLSDIIDRRVDAAVLASEKDFDGLRLDLLKLNAQALASNSQAIAEFERAAAAALERIADEQARVEAAGEKAVRHISGTVDVRLGPVASGEPEAGAQTQIITIPVVFHVIYTNDTQNISDEQISSQVSVLNEDFRARNPDIDQVPEPFRPLIGDAEIEFTLAQVARDGQPTSGITRKETERTSFSTNDEIKSAVTGGVDAWDTQRYLNVWVGNLDGNVVGYSQFPEGPERTDGVVLSYMAVGRTGAVQAPFDRGRAATEQIAHFLNLRHIWGDDGAACTGSDFVADTPNQAGPNSGKPSFPSISCDNGPHGDMFMNFMDYTDDDVRVMFTKGQVTRMRETLETKRSRLGVR